MPYVHALDRPYCVIEMENEFHHESLRAQESTIQGTSQRPKSMPARVVAAVWMHGVSSKKEV